MAVGMIAVLSGVHVWQKKGAAYVRPLYLIVTTLPIGKQVYEILVK